MKLLPLLLYLPPALSSGDGRCRLDTSWSSKGVARRLEAWMNSWRNNTGTAGQGELGGYLKGSVIYGGSVTEWFSHKKYWSQRGFDTKSVGN